MLHNLLIYRLLLWNGLGIVGIVWAWTAGYAQYLERDTSGISLAILALFGFGTAILFRRAIKVGRALNAIKRGNAPTVNPAKFAQKNTLIDFISSACVTMGFIGTVAGIITMLFGDAGVSTDGSAESVKALLTHILQGAGIAFITTAIGLITSLWLDFQNQMLRTATVSMIEDANA